MVNINDIQIGDTITCNEDADVSEDVEYTVIGIGRKQGGSIHSVDFKDDIEEVSVAYSGGILTHTPKDWTEGFEFEERDDGTNSVVVKVAGKRTGCIFMEPRMGETPEGMLRAALALVHYCKQKENK